MDTSAFFPHGYCLQWDKPLIALYVLTDALVALSYYSIPAALFVLAYKRRMTVPVQPLLLLFGLFIAFCGGGHAIDIVSLWHPVYWLKGLWNAGTAATSVVTAVVLIPRVMEIVRMPQTTEQLLREKSELQEQQSLVRAVLDSAWDGIVLTAENGKTLLFNSAAQRITGQETPSVPWAGHNTSDQDVVRLANGRLVERFTREVEGYGQLCVLRDITEKNAADEERARLQRVVESMRQGFAIITAPAGTIVSPI